MGSLRVRLALGFGVVLLMLLLTGVAAILQGREGASRTDYLLNSAMHREVAEGNVMVAKAGSTMEEIVGAVRRVTDIMGEISAASAEQSAGIEPVGETVTQIDQPTQQNAALVEEASAAARALEEQARGRLDAVAVFRVASHGPPAFAERAALSVVA